jgi:hypothetical protein
MTTLGQELCTSQLIFLAFSSNSHLSIRYAHGFLFPTEVTRVKRGMSAYIDKSTQDVFNNPSPAVGGTPTPSAWAYSSVSTFGVRYTPPLPDLSTTHSVEALVEGSDMSMIREGKNLLV